MSENTEKIMIVKGGGSKPGGFCFRNLGPNKDQVVEPGSVFPKDWIDPRTYEVLRKDKHLVDVTGETYKSPVVPIVPPAKDGEPKGTPFAELCVYDKGDLKDMSRADLDGIVADVYAQAGIEDVPTHANKTQIIAFLTGESI